jgi:hypothetical protein
VPSVSPLIWIVAFIEGFSTLAIEIIAIRLAIPVVGSSMTLTGVMLGVVLFALSAGYWRGGELSSRWDSRATRAALTRNLLLAGAIYAALSFPLEAMLLEKLHWRACSASTNSRRRSCSSLSRARRTAC